MKPWSYYSTPVKHPEPGRAEIEKFKSDTGASKYEVCCWIWDCAHRTDSELMDLEAEFILDSCEELGITREEYDRIDPYWEIIGCPPELYFPSPHEYEEMFMYLMSKIKKKTG